jgi:hypothetical protein
MKIEGKYTSILDKAEADVGQRRDAVELCFDFAGF